jgi:multicomponent Na+:H+ antiporter subunit D
MTLGLGLFTTAGIAGSIFYIVHHIIVKTNLFLMSGIVHRLCGTYELKKLGGLYASHPGLSILFLVPAFSLAGVPPLSGFFAKLTLIQAGLEAEQYVLVATALFVGLLTLFSMTKIWAEAFWKESPEVSDSKESPRIVSTVGVEFYLLTLPVFALAVVTVIIGLAVEPVYRLASRAAEQLMDPSDYIRIVIGGGS